MTTCAPPKSSVPSLTDTEIKQLTLRSTLSQLARNPGWGLFLQDGPHWATFGATYIQAQSDGLLTLWPGIGGRGLTITDAGRKWLREQMAADGGVQAVTVGADGEGEAR